VAQGKVLAKLIGGGRERCKGAKKQNGIFGMPSSFWSKQERMEGKGKEEVW